MSTSSNVTGYSGSVTLVDWNFDECTVQIADPYCELPAMQNIPDSDEWHPVT
jgi:hypothetical protein